MGKDYYKTLGVDKNATPDDIKKAFRTAAHKYHPDKNKGDATASDKFKAASEAYSILSNPEKRKQYDTFGSAGPGGAGFNGAGGYGAGAGGFGGQAGQGQGFGGFDFSQFTRQYGAGGQGFGGQGFGSQNGQSFEFDLGDIFGEFFGGGMGGSSGTRGGRSRRPRKGANVTVDVELPFRDAIFGVERELNLNIDGTTQKLTVTIPPGIESGQGLRVAGKGQDSPEKGTDRDGGPGDLIVRVWVKDHPTFRKEGFNLVMELPVKLTTALAGDTMDVETLDGKIELKIPAGTSHGEILRVRGKGVPYETQGIFTGASHAKRGDLLIVTHVEMPRKLSKNAQRLVDELKKEGI